LDCDPVALERTRVERLAAALDATIQHWPPRRYAGVVPQGDSAAAKAHPLPRAQDFGGRSLKYDVEYR
jgi:hypothetical protein